ncbi:MAG: EAL domain-containing protein [Rhodoferax sp.]
MNFNRFQRHSLRTRVTLFTLVIILISIWSLSLYTGRMLRKDMQGLLGNQQLSTVSLVATEINEELTDRLEALQRVASGTSAATMGNLAALQASLENRLVLQGLFNGGIFVIAPDGTAIAGIPAQAQRIGANYLDRDHVAAALKEGKSTIGRPAIGKKLKVPTLSMAVPIRDAKGQVVGALTGIINLSLPNVLDKISHSRYGLTGSYVLVARQHRMIVTTTDRNRVMELLPAPGTHPAIDRFIQGYAGTTIFVNPMGEEVLASVKDIPVADWYLAVMLPTAEAFATVDALQRRMLLATLLLTLLAGGLTWWMLGRHLAPLQATATTLAALADQNEPLGPLPVTRKDEIGQLINGFNRLLAGLAQRQEKLRQSEERYRTLTEWSPEPLIVHDGTTLLYVNPAAIRIIGAQCAQDLLGKPIMELVHPDFRAIVRARVMTGVVQRSTSPMLEEKFLKLDGTAIDVEVQSTPISYDGIPAVQVAIRDITERKAAQDQIQLLAFSDPLTNLPNRRLLLDRLKQAQNASSRHQQKGALLFIDLDNFKTINDTLGHEQGDLLLQQVAKRLIECVRESDTVARLGGDEFVVLQEQLSRNPREAATQAETVGEKILAALNKPFQDGLCGHRGTCSIGITLFGGSPNDNPAEPLKWAELAMYQAKAAGRNSLRFYDPQMQAAVSARAALEAGLREAIAKSQFLLHYQAQVTDQRQIIGVEALVRWNDPLRGMASPAEFIPLAEETGLILPLGRWVLEAACSQLAQWATRPAMAHLTLAVNVSARQFHQDDFIDQLLLILERTGANPQRLKLELTESVLVANVEGVIATMNALKGRGVSFSLDDFGTGYSSLSYLKRLPIDQLKIDQGFVRDILIDANDAAIAKMVIAMADSLGLNVIAEGVETEAQRDFLAGLGCHAYQGYLFSRPLPIQEFEALLQRA